MLSVLLRFTDSDGPLGIFDVQNPTQYLALFNLQKYIQNNLQVLNNVNIFKANDLPHRTYVTLTDLALLLIFIGIIIIKLCYYLLSYRNKGRITRVYQLFEHTYHYCSTALWNSFIGNCMLC